MFSDFGTVFEAPENDMANGSSPLCPATPTATKNCDVFDTAAFRASVGAGMIWESPFGPLRVDVAYPLLQGRL